MASTRNEVISSNGQSLVQPIYRVGLRQLVQEEKQSIISGFEHFMTIEQDLFLARTFE